MHCIAYTCDYLATLVCARCRIKKTPGCVSSALAIKAHKSTLAIMWLRSKPDSAPKTAPPQPPQKPLSPQVVADSPQPPQALGGAACSN